MRKFKYFLEFLGELVIRFAIVALTAFTFISIAVALYKLFTYQS